MVMATTDFSIFIEGIDEDGALQLGEMASLVIEGTLAPRLKPENCDLIITIGSSRRSGAGEEAGFSLSVADFLSGDGPFLCQIDFEAETVGGMSFKVELVHGRKVLAEAATSLRVINPLRDKSGKLRKTGAGALKVKK